MERGAERVGNEHLTEELKKTDPSPLRHVSCSLSLVSTLTQTHTHTHTHTLSLSLTHTHTKVFHSLFLQLNVLNLSRNQETKSIIPPSLSFVHLETFMSSLHPHTCPFSFAILILALLSFFVPLFVV